MSKQSHRAHKGKLDGAVSSTFSKKTAKEGKAHIKSLGCGTSAVGAGVDGLGKPNQDFSSDFGGSGSSSSARRSKPPKANGMGEPGKGCIEKAYNL